MGAESLQVLGIKHAVELPYTSFLSREAAILLNVQPDIDALTYVTPPKRHSVNHASAINKKSLEIPSASKSHSNRPDADPPSQFHQLLQVEPITGVTMDLQLVQSSEPGNHFLVTSLSPISVCQHARTPFSPWISRLHGYRKYKIP
jgi:hypothetical protein